MPDCKPLSSSLITTIVYLHQHQICTSLLIASIVRAGDWAYDLDSANSATGNAFMNGIQPYSSTHPYMGSIGNHEAYGTQVRQHAALNSCFTTFGVVFEHSSIGFSS